MNQENGSLLLDAAKGYFRNQGVNVMAFDDIYPEGRQAGVSVLMHGRRIASCGDVRFEPTPGQWQPVPRQVSRTQDENSNEIVVRLRYPNEEKSLRGMNPMIYPDLDLSYSVSVRGEGPSVIVTVDLDNPVPEDFQGRVCFNLELFPGVLFGQPWIMDQQTGVFPRQPNGLVRHQPSLVNRSGHQRMNPDSGPPASRERLLGDGKTYNPIAADEWIAVPYAAGRALTVCPDDPFTRLRIECLTPDADLRLYDGRMNHNNGWFVVSSVLPAGRAEKALCWRITPHAVPGWRSPTVIQLSQVGYHPGQAKRAVLEMDPETPLPAAVELCRIDACSDGPVRTLQPVAWGPFLRYQYAHVDFSDVQEEGLYRLRCGEAASSVFRISRDVYDRGVWQPVLEYFLPVQMCHMRVQEKYRVWHGLCHKDDACMAPTCLNHFDGYVQGDSTLTSLRSGEHVPGLNAGG